MSNPTITQTKEKKARIEQAIELEIKTFETETGVIIDTITVERQSFQDQCGRIIYDPAYVKVITASL